MKKTIAILIFLGIVFSISCKNFQKPKTMDDVKIGMSIEEVKKLIGFPVSQFNGHTALTDWTENCTLDYGDEGMGHVKIQGQLIELTWVYDESKTDTIHTPQYSLDKCIENNNQLKEMNAKYGIKLRNTSLNDCSSHNYKILSSRAIIFDRSTGTVSLVTYLPLAVIEIK
jgi:hypothetical protein